MQFLPQHIYIYIAFRLSVHSIERIPFTITIIVSYQSRNTEAAIVVMIIVHMIITPHYVPLYRGCCSVMLTLMNIDP